MDISQQVFLESFTTSVLGASSGIVKAGPGQAHACLAKVRPAHVCASTCVVSAMVKHIAGAQPIPMTWLHH